MEKLKKSIWINLKMPYIYLNDIQNMIEILIENNSKTDISIKTENFSYNGISELSKEDTIINNLEINSRDPYISIDFHKTDAKIYSSSDDTISRGIVSKLMEILNRRERKILNFTTRYGGFADFVMISAWILLMFSKIIPFLRFISVGLFIFSVIWFIISKLINSKYYSVINLKDRGKAPDFFSRNKDQIIIGIIIGIIFFVAGILVQRFLIH